MISIEEIRNGASGYELLTFEMIVCPACKVPFMISQAHKERLIKSGDTFFCPNGHNQFYPAESCNKDLKKAKERVETLQQRLDREIQENWDLRQKVKDLRKTECKICGKRFINIDRHIVKHHQS